MLGTALTQPLRSDDRVREFPFADEMTYLNHAASSPLPARSADALRRHVSERQRLFDLYQTGTQDYDPTALRAKLGRLVNAAPQSIGFAPTTSDGISGTLNAIDWRPGDNLVVAANDYPGVLYACDCLVRRGVEVRKVPMPNGHLELERLVDALDPRTRALAASHVHWQTGYRVDLQSLGRACNDRGVLSVIDAIQSLGSQPIDLAVTPVDVLVAGAYKWLLGVPGVAVLYVSPRALEWLVPDRAGWVSMRTSVYAEPRVDWLPDAMRFMAGAPTNAALVALEQSVELLLEVGVAAIARHTAGLVGALAAGAARPGMRINSRLTPECRSSIVSVTTGDPDRDLALLRDLVAQRIIVAQRGPGLRIAPHLHNLSEDVERLLDALGRALTAS